MNELDKFSVSFEIWWNRYVLRMSNERNLRALMRMFAKEKPELVEHILGRFNKHKCDACNGKGYLD